MRSADILKSDYGKDIEELAWDVIHFHIPMSGNTWQAIFELLGQVLNEADEIRFKKEYRRRYGYLYKSDSWLDSDDLANGGEIEKNGQVGLLFNKIFMSPQEEWLLRCAGTGSGQ